MVFDAVARCQGNVLPLQSFKDAGALEIQATDSQDNQNLVFPGLANFPDRLPTLKEAEESLISEALRRADNNQGIAAGLLGISRQALNKRLIRRDADMSTSD